MPNVERITLTGSELPIYGAKQVESLPHDREIDVILHLRRKTSSPGLPTADDLATNVPTRLTREELTAAHGANPEDIDKVCSFLYSYGLTVHQKDLTTRLVHARGSIANASRAFGVYLGIYTHINYDRNFRAYLGAVTIPAELDGIVLGVHGLDDRPTLRPHIQYSPDLSTASCLGEKAEGVEKTYPGSFLPPKVARLYEFPKVTGKGQSIGIIEIGGRYGGGFDPSVLQWYFESVTKTAIPRVIPVPVMGSTNNPSGPGSGEVYLDIEIVGSIAPDAEIAVYFGDQLGIAIKQAIADPERNLTAITISYGGLEKYNSQQEIHLMEEALQEAALMGIPVFISSGDNGSGALRSQVSGEFTTLAAYANVSYPSTSPYAIACGGTSLVAAKDGGIQSETVWNNVNFGPDPKPGQNFPGGAGGGGVSILFDDVPDYQRKAGVSPQSVNPGTATGRGVPDVAGNADPNTGYIVTNTTDKGTTLMPVGGTSAVAPLWAALSALLGESLATSGPLTMLTHKFLYENGLSSIFRPITEGNNNTSPPVGGYQAGPGWNACAGWGSPNGLQILSKLRTIKTRP